MTTDGLNIGDLARETRVKVETIRYYERIGLLPEPPRSDGNYRRYGATHLRRLSFVRRSRDLGFTLEQIRGLLALADRPDRDCGEIDALAREHLVEVDRKIADLTALRDELGDMIDHCGRRTVGECRIVQALSGG